MKHLLRETEDCMLYQSGTQYRLATKTKAKPKSRRVARLEIQYLMSLPDDSFDAGAIIDYGVGVHE